MSIELDYSTQEEITEKLNLTLEQTNKILNDNMEDWFNSIVIPEMKRLAIAMNLPKGFVDGIKFIKKGDHTGKLVNVWGSQKKPLAKWFNYGTIDHWIQPLFKKVLSWASKGSGGNASAINFQSYGDFSGKRFFSTGHYVSGLKRTEAMEFGIKYGKKQLNSQLPKLIQEKMQ